MNAYVWGVGQGEEWLGSFGNMHSSQTCMLEQVPCSSLLVLTDVSDCCEDLASYSYMWHPCIRGYGHVSVVLVYAEGGCEYEISIQLSLYKTGMLQVQHT